MFTFLGDGVDSLYKILWLLVGFNLVFSGGLGLVFRIITKPIGIRFNNKNLKELDEELSDLQLLKIYHGINVSSTEDAEMAALAITRGKIKPQKIWLTMFSPAIGKSRQGKFELFLMLFFFSYCFGSSLYIGYDLKEYRSGYVSLSNKNEVILISDLYVIDKKNHKTYNNPKCKTLPKQSSELLKQACEYLTTDDPYLKKELAFAIQKNNENMNGTFAACLFFFLLSLFTAVAYFSYRDINNAFYAFKTSEKAHRKANMYKKVFNDHKNTQG
ncbi:hypothetical protein SMC87_003856 [Cronobacter dublinensis]|nr:hypothetical protein [Cronobacter dublinensis]